MRPRGSTLVISAHTMPAPPAARAARCWKCQSVGAPSAEEYWHIGDTMMRLRAVTERNVIGRKMCGFGSRCEDPALVLALARARIGLGFQCP